jgi:membrane protein implicated in regulation of membrane protease activity
MPIPPLAQNNFMNGFVLMTLLAGAGTIYSFLFGVRAMAHGGQRSSAVWMSWRVAFQSAAVLTILGAMLSR